MQDRTYLWDGVVVKGVPDEVEVALHFLVNEVGMVTVMKRVSHNTLVEGLQPFGICVGGALQTCLKA